MDNPPPQRRTPPVRLVDSTPDAAEYGPDHLPSRLAVWLERLGWTVFGLLVLALWIRIGLWLWRVIAG